MINEIYNKKILEFAADIPRLQRLNAPDATAVAISRLCGSKVTVDVKMDGDVVSDFGHEVKACALGQASSSIMARHVVGSTAKTKALPCIEECRAASSSRSFWDRDPRKKMTAPFATFSGDFALCILCMIMQLCPVYQRALPRSPAATFVSNCQRANGRTGRRWVKPGK